MKKLLLFFLILLSFGSLSQTTLIYTQDFAATNPTGWTVINAGTGNNWSMISTSGPYNGSYAMVYSYNSTQAANTWAFTQGVSMTAGRTYRVEFYQKTGSSLYTEKMKVTVGTAQTVASQTTTLLDLNSLTSTTYANQVTSEYSCTSTGTYYFAFNCYSAKNKLTLHVDNVRIYETIPTAPTCASLSAPSNGATGVSLSQVISWAATSGATGYDVYFGTSPTPPLVSTNQAGTTYTSTLSSGTLYYFKVVPKNSVGSATGCSTWSFTTLSPPTNDACSGATSLPCATSSLAGTTVNSVSEIPPASASVSSYGVWYSFTGDGQQTTISSTAVFDHEMVILTGTSCGSFTIVASQDNTLSNSAESYTFTTTNSQQYYVFIAHYSTTSTTTGTFTISRTCTAPPTPPSNDACSAATSLPCATSNLAGTTVNSVSETAPGGGGYASNYGVWYTFTGDGGQTTVSATGNSFDIEMTIVSGTCSSNTLVSSQDNAGSTGTETYTFTTTNSTVYYVYVAYWSSTGTSSDVGTFTISRTCVAPCTTPTTAGTLTANLYSTTVNDAVTFTTTGNGGSITKFEWSYNNFSTIAGTTNNPANPYTLILNVQQPTIYFRTTSVSGTCPAGVTTPISVTLQSAPAYVYGTSSGDYITNVTLNTLNNNSTYDSPLGDSYQDFTNLNTTLIKGSSYTISSSSTSTYGSYSGYAAWIDFNNNGVFEVSENIMQKNAGATKSQTFTVPTDASTALVKMRVLSAWSTTPSTDAYYSTGYNWGEIEEYKINIQAALPIELTSFEGVNKGANNILFWSTATEHNSNYFNLQKSRDGETWETISTINAAGNSTTHIDYDVTDYKVEPIINYYRLQQYDFDGTYETYGPITINNMDMGIKTVVKLLNLAGQEIDWEQATAAGVYIEVYSDGTSKKVYR